MRLKFIAATSAALSLVGCGGDRSSDWLCTFVYASTLGYVYVQATAVSCTFRYTISTTFATRAWLSLDGQVTELTDAHYDWGDYHHVDYLTFGHGALCFEYGHSSLGSYYLLWLRGLPRQLHLAVLHLSDREQSRRDRRISLADLCAIT